MGHGAGERQRSPRASGSNPIELSSVAEATGAGFLDFCQQIAAAGRPGIVDVDIAIAAHIVIADLAGLDIAFRPGKGFIDGGRLVEGANAASRRLPWGLKFLRCDRLKMTGGAYRTQGSGLTGSSSGFFGAANYVTLGKNCLAIEASHDVMLRRFMLSGNPGVGMTLADAIAIDDARGLALTPTAGLALSFARAFFQAKDCRNIFLEDCGISGGAAREYWVLIGCSGAMIRPSAISDGQQFQSFGKILAVPPRGFLIERPDIRDTSPGSLFDVIGTNVTLRGGAIDYPHGKLIDVSTEYARYNMPSRGVLVTDIATTGQGVTGVVNTSSPSEVAQGAPGGVTVRKLRAFSARLAEADWLRQDVTGIRLVNARDYTVEGLGAVNWSPAGFTHTEVTTRWDWRGCTLHWTKSTAALATNARTIDVCATANITGCMLTGERNVATEIAVTGAGKLYIAGSVLRDLDFSVAAGVEVIIAGTIERNVAWTGAGRVTRP